MTESQKIRLRVRRDDRESGERTVCQKIRLRVRRDDRKSEESERDERESGEMPESQ